jgi:hypothetical protein
MGSLLETRSRCCWRTSSSLRTCGLFGSSVETLAFAPGCGPYDPWSWTIHATVECTPPPVDIAMVGATKQRCGIHIRSFSGLKYWPHCSYCLRIGWANTTILYSLHQATSVGVPKKTTVILVVYTTTQKTEYFYWQLDFCTQKKF